jgi:DNA repair protein RadC
MAKPSFQEKSEVAAAIICPESNHEHAILHINTEDVRVTEMLVEASKLLDIAVLDHIVIGRNRYVSLKERGLGFK